MLKVSELYNYTDILFIESHDEIYVKTSLNSDLSADLECQGELYTKAKVVDKCIDIVYLDNDVESRGLYVTYNNKINILINTTDGFISETLDISDIFVISSKIDLLTKRSQKYHQKLNQIYNGLIPANLEIFKRNLIKTTEDLRGFGVGSPISLLIPNEKNELVELISQVKNITISKINKEPYLNIDIPKDLKGISIDYLRSLNNQNEFFINIITGIININIHSNYIKDDIQFTSIYNKHGDKQIKYFYDYCELCNHLIKLINKVKKKKISVGLREFYFNKVSSNANLNDSVIKFYLHYSVICDRTEIATYSEHVFDVKIKIRGKGYEEICNNWCSLITDKLNEECHVK